jgi:hypothetical protein
MKLKTIEDIEIATTKFISILQQAAQAATPKKHTLSPASNLPSEIKHIPHVRTVFREWTATHHTTLDSHPNPLMKPIVPPPNNRRLKRRWTFDEIH